MMPNGAPRSNERDLEPASHTAVGVVSLLCLVLAFAGLAWVFAPDEGEQDQPVPVALVEGSSHD